MSDSTRAPEPLADRLTRASFRKRLVLLWPSLLVVAVLVVGSGLAIKQATDAEDARRQEASRSLDSIDLAINDLAQETDNARESVRRLLLSMRDETGVAFSGDQTFPTSQDKSVILYALLSLLAMVTLGSLWALLFSPNPRVVTHAMDALKMLGGFYVGLMGSIFGLRG